MSNTKHLISIIGPTAIGKTNLAIALSKKYSAPILSSDSRQFYREMCIGTAVPSKEELAAAPHFFIQHKSIQDSYIIGDFEREAMGFLKNHYLSNDIAIMVGGSGLYTDAVCKGLDKFPEVPDQIRNDLNEALINHGLETLTNKLKDLDPKAFEQIAIDNPVRVIRALEVCLASGKPYSSYLNQHKDKRPFKVHYLNITAPRETIYERINLRVDLMIKNGLEEEVRDLLDHKNLNALNTVGYKEFFRYIEGEITLLAAIEEIKKNSRRFAKRQMTWNRKNTQAIAVNYNKALEDSMTFLDKAIPTSKDVDS